jgi:hypothetical protein
MGMLKQRQCEQWEQWCQLWSWKPLPMCELQRVDKLSRNQAQTTLTWAGTICFAHELNRKLCPKLCRSPRFMGAMRAKMPGSSHLADGDDIPRTIKQPDPIEDHSLANHSLANHSLANHSLANANHFLLGGSAEPPSGPMRRRSVSGPRPPRPLPWSRSAALKDLWIEVTLGASPCG